MILNGKEIEIDELFEPIIKILNEKGYLTLFCCSGHEQTKYYDNGLKSDPTHSYIFFHPEVDLPNYPPNYRYSYPNIIKCNVSAFELKNNADEVLKWAENLPVNPIKIGD